MTTLYIPETELEKGENTIFTCVVAVPGTERTVQATPELRFYSKECCCCWSFGWYLLICNQYENEGSSMKKVI